MCEPLVISTVSFSPSKTFVCFNNGVTYTILSCGEFGWTEEESEATTSKSKFNGIDGLITAGQIIRSHDSAEIFLILQGRCQCWMSNTIN